MKESIQFLEFGKYKNRFENRASDFTKLIYSPNFKLHSEELRKALAFPINANFTDTIGNVSFALIYFDKIDNQSRYLFVQLQSRREGEFSDNPPTNRPFMQERYTIIEAKTLRKIVKAGYEPYSPLIIRSNQQSDANNIGLKIYQDDDLGTQEYWVTYESQKYFEKPPMPYLQQYLAGTEKHPSLSLMLQKIATIADAVVRYNYVQVNSNGLDIEEQLLIVQAVQRLVFPSIGIMTFALDHVTSQTVRLQFFNDTPIPSRVQPIVVSLPAKQASYDVGQNSYSRYMFQFMQDLKTIIPASLDFQQVWVRVNQGLLAEEIVLAFQKGGEAVNAIDAYWLHYYTKRLKDVVPRFKRSHQFLSDESFLRVLDALELTEQIALLDERELQKHVLPVLRARLSLPQFAKILVDKELVLSKPEMVEQLKLSAQESSSSIIKQCSENTLNFLLDLRESTPIYFADKKELLLALTEVADPQLDSLLVQRLKTGDLVEPILEALFQASQEDLLTFFIEKGQFHEIKNHLSLIPFIIRLSNSESLRQANENILKTLIVTREQKPLQFQDGIDLLDAFAIPKNELFDKVLGECLQSKRLVEPILGAIERVGRSDLINFYVRVPDISPDLLKHMLRHLIRPEQKKSLITNGKKLQQILEPFVQGNEINNALNLFGLEAKDREQLGQICLEISSGSPMFAQWFLYNTFLGLVKDDEDDTDTYFEKIVFELLSSMRVNPQLRGEFGRTSVEFQSLVKRYENDTK